MIERDLEARITAALSALREAAADLRLVSGRLEAELRRPMMSEPKSRNGKRITRGEAEPGA